MRREEKTAIILAAGKGKRMKSGLPKVLHQIDNSPMVEYVINNARQAGFDNIIMVVGHKHEQVISHFKDKGIEFVVQYEQKGTGHAVKCAEANYSGFKGIILVLAGDMPLVSVETLKKLTVSHIESGAVATVLTVKLPDPTGYGRIIRDADGGFKKIVEHREADPETLKIDEVNTGIICFDSEQLVGVLNKLDCDNDQGEYYLTDSIGIFSEEGKKVNAVIADNYHEGMGINSIEQLSEVEKILKSC